MLVREFAFEAEHAEIVTEDGVDVVAGLVPQTLSIRDCHCRIGEVQLELPRLHYAGVDPDVDGSVARHCRAREASGNKRRGNDQLAHRGVPSVQDRV